ncbi:MULTISPECIES: hypothetical protein [Bacillus]|uniref:hypothetical protein n=1 Tax=Bacillus TaxID=1386 RepID=UPI00209D0941|nr:MULTISPECIES: hypothetical protein [Bacillus]MCP1159380.1 hypothetical protein [Bacillus infantis]MDT0160341.1 hypothetical protein [Bacillus sp. AG4(2022)]
MEQFKIKHIDDLANLLLEDLLVYYKQCVILNHGNDDYDDIISDIEIEIINRI